MTGTCDVHGILRKCRFLLKLVSSTLREKLLFAKGGVGVAADTGVATGSPPLYGSRHFAGDNCKAVVFYVLRSSREESAARTRYPLSTAAFDTLALY